LYYYTCTSRDHTPSNYYSIYIHHIDHWLEISTSPTE